ncbi:hypothetical protein [Paraburkholderia sp. BCC1876]|uniref:hypothetical protein n=1 Tax=Paraburkholderia sp. BCC1876 TaxID=2676303 RepID=UPI001590EA71|nr:hypothetical protein [Paraburkholderia sp. BCC1876]
MNTMPMNDELLRQALKQDWQDHTKKPEGVAERLWTRLSSPMGESDLVELAALASHVFGEHLGDWQNGIRYLEQLGHEHPHASLACCSRVKRQQAVLVKAQDSTVRLDSFDEQDQFYITALALPAITLQRSAQEGEEIFTEAIQLMVALDSRAQRRLFGVVTANLVCDLLERSTLSGGERNFLVTLAEKSYGIWSQEGDESDREKAGFRLVQCYQKCRMPENYGSGRYARFLFIEP